MLVLTRKPNQSIRIGDDITVNVVRVRGNTIQLGIEAPRQVNIVRSELLEHESAQESGQEIESADTEDCDRCAQPDLSLLEMSLGDNLRSSLVTAV